ncbi:MAG TPA: hypothetical protein VEB21_20925 [Terriglobales bacterium]|nr:hypothetical protein [Terriglobales bacterium]
MGSITDLKSRRNQPLPPRRTNGNGNGRYVQCEQCAERHPIIRLANGHERCFTAFSDGSRWFCQNRGCRAAWLAGK